MRLYQAALARISGTVMPEFQNAVAQDLDSRAEELLIAAAYRWRRDRWYRFNDDEVNCTVQMYRHSRECIRDDRRFALITVHLEWIDVTPDILKGKQSATTAKRPDLRFEVGQAGRTIECKRIAATGPWARRYVDDGLARFVTGTYGHAEATGFMIGYVLGGQFPSLVNRINYYIQRHADMGQDQQVKVTTKRHSPPILVGVSQHSRSNSQANLTNIDISHLLLRLDS